MDENNTSGSDFSLDVELNYDRALGDLEKFFETLRARSAVALGDIKVNTAPVAALGQVSKGSEGHVSSLVERTDSLTASMDTLRSAANDLAKAMGKGYAKQFIEHAQAMMVAADADVNARTMNMRRVAALDSKYRDQMADSAKKRLQNQVRSYADILKATDQFTEAQIKRLAEMEFGQLAYADAMLPMTQRIERRLRELRLAEMSTTGQEVRKAGLAEHKRRVDQIKAQGAEVAALEARNAAFLTKKPAQRRAVVQHIQDVKRRVARNIATRLPADADRDLVAERAEQKLIGKYGDVAVGAANLYEGRNRTGFGVHAAQEKLLTKSRMESAAAAQAEEDRKQRAADAKAARYRRSHLTELKRSADEQYREQKALLQDWLKAKDKHTAAQESAERTANRAAVKASAAMHQESLVREAAELKSLKKLRDRGHAEALADIKSNSDEMYTAAKRDAAYQALTGEKQLDRLAQLAERRASLERSQRLSGHAYGPAVARANEAKLLREFGPQAVQELNEAMSAVGNIDTEAFARARREMVDTHKQRKALQEDLNRTQQEANTRLEQAARARFNRLSKEEQRATLKSVADRLARNEQMDDIAPWMLRKAAGYTSRSAEVKKPEHTKLREMFGVQGEQSYRDLGNQWHSAARGVTGVAGGTWMTYGDLIPIATAAAATATAYMVGSKGAAYSRDLGYVRELSRTPEQSDTMLRERISGLSDNLLQRSRYSGYSATEQIGSVRTLAQAGYNATQANAMVPQVNALATVGDTTTDTAAITLAGTMSAFQMDPSQASRVANVMAMAANESQTSVESLNESMKQASSVASEYGVSLEDTATVLALLAKRNITGSAAGTAFKNMLVDLGGRTRQSTKYIKELGIELYDAASGRAKALPVVLDQVLAKLSTLSQRERNFYTHKIFTERGLKPVAAVLGEGMGEYDRMKGRIEESQSGGGYVAQAEKRLNEGTASGQWKMVKNSLEAEAIEAFLRSEDDLIAAMKAIRAELNGGGISGALQTFISGVSTAAKFTAQFSGVLTSLAGAIGAYGAFRILGGGIALIYTQGRLAKVALGELSAATVVWRSTSAAATASTLTLATAEQVAEARTIALGRAFRFLQVGIPVIGAALLGATLLYDALTESASETREELERTDYAKMADEASTGFEEVHRRGQSMYQSLVSEGSTYAKREAKTVQEAIDNGERLLKAADQTQQYLTRTSAGSAAQIHQEYRDRQRLIIQDTFEDAKRLYDGTAEGRQKLLELAANAANEEVRIEREKVAEIVKANSQLYGDKLTSLVPVRQMGMRKDDAGVMVGDPKELLQLLQNKVNPAWHESLRGAQLGERQRTDLLQLQDGMSSVYAKYPELKSNKEISRLVGIMGKVLAKDPTMQIRDALDATRIQVNDVRGTPNSPNKPGEAGGRNRTADNAESLQAKAEAGASRRTVARRRPA